LNDTGLSNFVFKTFFTSEETWTDPVRDGEIGIGWKRQKIALHSFADDLRLYSTVADWY
jgi:hypothetical protein